MADDNGKGCSPGHLGAERIADQRRIGKHQKFEEGLVMVVDGVPVVVVDIAREQDIQFSHAAAALPSQPGFINT